MDEGLTVSNPIRNQAHHVPCIIKHLCIRRRDLHQFVPCQAHRRHRLLDPYNDMTMHCIPKSSDISER